MKIGNSDTRVEIMARINLRAKGQVTLPEDIRRELALEEGDVFEVDITSEGILLRPQRLVDASQAWFWLRKWQEGEREVDQLYAGAEYEEFESGEAMIEELQSIAKKK